MKLSLAVILMQYLFNVSRQFPQIFEQIQTCTVSTQQTKLTIPNYITADNEEINLILSICGEIPNAITTIETCTKVCLFDKKAKTFVHPKNPDEVHFELEDSSGTDFIFKLHGKLKCGTDGNYNITVRMVSNSNFKEPRLVSKACELELEMLNPNYTPPCTHLLGPGQMIDLRPLKGEFLMVPFKGEEFHVSLCGSNKACGPDGSACKITNNSVFLFGSTKYQKIDYDFEKNSLTVKSWYKGQMKKRLTMEVILDCDWKTPNFSNARYIEPPTQGRHFKFRVDSSYGCLKIPASCLLYDETKQLTYDLRKLYRKGGYQLNNGSTSVRFNICGQLFVEGPEENNCNVEKAQVCEINGDNFINKGSSPFYEITTDNFVRAYFRNGKQCQNTGTFTTTIDIRCSFQEAISLISSEVCAMHLLWETPNACPIFEKKTTGCSIFTPSGNVDLSTLYRKIDRIYRFSDGNWIEYNICGNIHSNCSFNSNVSACFTKNGHQHIVASGIPILSYQNGNLRLQYNGEICPRTHRHWSLIINLNCSYDENNDKNEVITKDDCNFIVNTSSEEACFSKETVDCTYLDDNVFYDLTPLLSKQKNYEINDTSDKNITYYLNVCTTLINTLTFTNSMVSMRNKSKPHILDTYSSLGKIAKPELKEGSLFIHSILGFTCEPAVHYSSYIRFECSSNPGQPELLTKTGCVYEFLWKTPYACPKIRNRCYLDLDLPKDNIEIEVDPSGIKYTFCICSEVYTICANKSCSSHGLTQRPRKLSDDNLQIELELDKVGGFPLRTVNVTIYCDPNELDIHSGSIEDGKIDIVIRTKRLCKTVNNIEEITHDINELVQTTGTFNKSVVQYTDESTIDENITIITKKQNSDMIVKERRNSTIKNIEPILLIKNQNEVTQKFPQCKNDKFDLRKIKSSEIHKRNNYIINFDNTSKNCNGLICRNNLPILRSSDECPSIFPSETFVNFSYSLNGKCGGSSTESQRRKNFNINILLKCDSTQKYFTSVKYEEDCTIEFESFSPDACDILDGDKGLKKVLFAMGSLLIFLAICIFLWISYKKNYCKKCSYIRVQASEQIPATHFKVP